jgi:hypothetical protein
VDQTLLTFLVVIFTAIFLYCLYGVIYRAVRNAIRDSIAEAGQSELVIRKKAGDTDSL